MIVSFGLIDWFGGNTWMDDNNGRLFHPSGRWVSVFWLYQHHWSHPSSAPWLPRPQLSDLYLGEFPVIQSSLSALKCAVAANLTNGVFDCCILRDQIRSVRTIQYWHHIYYVIDDSSKLSTLHVVDASFHDQFPIHVEDSHDATRILLV